MRHNLSALQFDLNYSKAEHSTLFKNMRLGNRDHYHLREGQKEDMPFICLIKADLTSPEKFLKGYIGGRDDDRKRLNELLSICFDVKIAESGKAYISINSSDRTTPYEQSIKLAHYCLATMAKKSVELTVAAGSGGNNGKKGFYPQSAQSRGIFSTFEKTFDKAETELVLPADMRDFFLEANYNLIHYK